MIPIALSLASRIVSGPRAQKVMAWLIIAAGACLLAWLLYLVAASWIQSGKDAAVKEDRREATLDATKIDAAADKKAAWDHQADEIMRERERANVTEAINESIRDPDGDPLRATFDRMR